MRCQAIKQNKNLCNKPEFKANLCINHYRQSLEGSAREDFDKWKKHLERKVEKPLKRCITCSDVIYKPMGNQKYCTYCKKQVEKLRRLLATRDGEEIKWT